MKLQLIQPQEVEVFYIIPAIRREMSIAMKSAGVKQKEIARRLCVEESTISQYLHDKRAATLALTGGVKKAIAESSVKVKDKTTLIAETQKLLGIIKKEKLLCRIHTAVSDVPKSCNACFV